MCPVPLTPEVPGRRKGTQHGCVKVGARSHRRSDTFLCHTSTQSLHVPPVRQEPSGAPRFLLMAARPNRRGFVVGPSRALPSRLTRNAQTRQAAPPGCGHVTCCSLPLRRKCGRAPRASEKPQRVISSGLRRSARYSPISSSERTRQKGRCLLPARRALLTPSQTRVSSGERKGGSTPASEAGAASERLRTKRISECLSQGLEVSTDNLNARSHSREHERCRGRVPAGVRFPSITHGDVLPPPRDVQPGGLRAHCARADTLPKTGRPLSGCNRGRNRGCRADTRGSQGGKGRGLPGCPRPALLRRGQEAAPQPVCPP